MSKIRELHNKLVSKEISCVELTKQYLSKAKERNEELNCFITLSEDKALEQAQKVDEDIATGKDIPLLAGIPASAKDLYCVDNVRSTGGSKILDDFVPPYSATAIKKLEEEGMVLIGKNNCDELAQGGANTNSAYGPAKNPHNLERITGGSSGGSAAAVAADLSVYSLGTDTGGSIRQPASFCGCVGLKVTYGRTSRFGVMAMASSLDTIGPLTQTVEDAAIILEALAGKDVNDSTTLDAPVPKYTEALKKDISGMKVGIPKEYFEEGLSPEIKEAVMKGIEELKALGAHVKEVSLPMTKYAIATYYIISPAEVSSNMARYDGLRYGPTITEPQDLEDLYLSNRMNGFGDEVKRRIMIGTYVLSHGYYDAYYKKAQKVRTLIKMEFEEVFKEVDILATPVSPVLPWRLDEKPDPLTEYLADAYTLPASIAGIPGLSLPVTTVEGLPVGLQLLAPQLAEERLLNVGYQLEQKIGFTI